MEFESLIEEMENTLDAARRNEIALQLMDMKYDSAVHVLVELIKKLRNTDNVGTLIYALGGLNCAEYISDTELLNIIFHGNWETSNQMLAVFKKEYKNMNNESKEKCREKFMKEKERAEDTIEMIDDLLDNLFDV